MSLIYELNYCPACGEEMKTPNAKIRKGVFRGWNGKIPICNLCIKDLEGSI
jgi:hypothetical protein